MSIVFGLTLFGWHIGKFDVRIELDEARPVTRPVVGGACKRLSRRWVNAMTS
jgi:hypothetical protein